MENLANTQLENILNSEEFCNSNDDCDNPLFVGQKTDLAQVTEIIPVSEIIVEDIAIDYVDETNYCMEKEGNNRVEIIIDENEYVELESSLECYGGNEAREKAPEGKQMTRDDQIQGEQQNFEQEANMEKNLERDIIDQDEHVKDENDGNESNKIGTVKALRKIQSLNKNSTIGKDVQSFYNREKNRWRAIIERMIAVVQFLASLAFLGSTSELYKRDNGNFLKAVEMLDKFDSVISEHLNNIRKSKESQMRTPQYLGINFQNEIIDILAGAIKNEIVKIIKNAKYFSIILDSTPDVSHVEQITFIVRCVNITADKIEICEFFLGFFPVTNTTGEGLSNFLLRTLLPSFDLNVEDIRGQGYDNGANMRGKNIGLRRQILNINPRALYIPCAAHPLNLVVNDAATATGEITGFFDTIQEVYI